MLDLQKIAQSVIAEVGRETLQRAESMKPDEVEENGSVEFFDGGFVIKYSEEMSGYLEWGTGSSETVKIGISAKQYLADKPQEIKDEAMKLYKNGRGTIGAQPYLYPAMLWALDEIPKRIERETLSVWNGLRF